MGITAGAKTGGDAGHCGISWFVAQMVLLVGANDRFANWNWHSPHVDTFWSDKSLHIVIHARSLEHEGKKHEAANQLCPFSEFVRMRTIRPTSQ